MEGGGGGGGGGGGTVCSSKTWFGRTAHKFAALTDASGAGGTGASLDADTLATASRLMAESYGAPRAPALSRRNTAMAPLSPSIFTRPPLSFPPAPRQRTCLARAAW